MIQTCRQDAVALSLFGKLCAVLAPVDCGFWHARCSTSDDHRGQSCHNYLSGLIRYRWRNCRGEVYNVDKGNMNQVIVYNLSMSTA